MYRVTMGHLRLTIGYLKATVVWVTLGHFKVTIGYSISKHKANITELHPKVRQTCYTVNPFSIFEIPTRFNKRMLVENTELYNPSIYNRHAGGAGPAGEWR